MNSIILIGGGGHCKSCIDVIEQAGLFTIVGIVDVPAKLHQKVLGYQVSGSDEDLPELIKECPNFLITLGQIKSAERRIEIYSWLKLQGAVSPVIVSPLAYVSRHATIGESTIVMHGAVVNAGAKIGSNCIINSKALLEHDVEIGKHCHISTGALINGKVKIGEGSFIGSGVVVHHDIRVGDNCVIGAGCVIKSDISDKQVVRK